MFSFMLSAYCSNSGKTVFSGAVARAFVNRGLKVSPFKCGPDYIDTMWLSRAAGTQAYNLDPVIYGEERVKKLYTSKVSVNDGALVEGVMGFFDGLDPVDFTGSSYHVARLLQLPVVIILNVAGMAASSTAVVAGIRQLARDVTIAGVILNKVSSPRQQEIIQKTFRGHLPDMSVLGAVPEIETLLIPSRHLGLTSPPEEREDYFNSAAEMAEKYVDLDQLSALKSTLPPDRQPVSKPPPSKKAYIAFDEAFSFYYPTTFELLENRGYKIIKFSPLKNEPVSEEANLILLGGGYPELYADILSKAHFTRQSLQEAHRRAVPIFAECGGFVYLCKSLTIEGIAYEMAGLFEIECEMTGHRQRLGYVEIEWRNGKKSLGHAFHYSRIKACREPIWGNITRLSSREESPDGFLKNRTYGGYTHFMPHEEDDLFISFLEGRL